MADARLGRFFDNQLKKRLNANELQIGLWSSSCSNLVAELLSYAGFDWVLLDSEHAPNDLSELIGQMQAFYILNGDHQAAYAELIPQGLPACLAYFQANAASINKHSDRIPEA